MKLKQKQDTINVKELCNLNPSRKPASTTKLVLAQDVGDRSRTLHSVPAPHGIPSRPSWLKGADMDCVTAERLVYKY